MQSIGHGRFSKRAQLAALALIACAALAAPAVQAMPWKTLVVVPPAKLPDSARQGGEAMLLHDSPDGRTWLYIERDAGSRLAVFDVTDPARIKAAGSVHIDAGAAFDFVAALGEDAELIRFRASLASAVLDLHQAQAPTLRLTDGRALQGEISALGADGYTISTPLAAGAPPTRDYAVVDAAGARSLSTLAEVPQVRQDITRGATGTTFLLTDNGLYLIRRPGVELYKQQRDLDYAN